MLLIRSLLGGLLLALFIPWHVHADSMPELARLQALADERNLAEHREWQDLLHYRERRFLPGRRSATRSRSFFNAEYGWRDPRAELDATLDAFFRPVDSLSEDEQHPQCRFVARRAWLVEALDIPEGTLPAVECSRFDEWREAIDPDEITLVFAAAYLNNPASMFGHTLLRVDPTGQVDDVRLLSYVINHAAATSETSGFIFAVRGLTGGYPGVFSIMPYYEKVREYSALENRDLWEYRLSLDSEEVERLLMHTWELREAAFPYYFLYQNCSYRLLSLLDVARPGMGLSDRFSWYAIPTDTVRVTLEQEGLLEEVVYRPAERTVLGARLDRLDDDGRALALGLAQGELEPEGDALEGLEPADRAELLETAYGYLHFRLSRGDIRASERARMRELLLARSKLPARRERIPVETPDVRPDEGHGTLRLGLGGGRRGDANFVSLHWRPAYHDFLDPPAGYIPGAHIAYGDVELRYEADREAVSLERLMLVDIESISPRSRFFPNWSWRIRGGAEQHLRPGGEYSLMAGVAGGGGYAWANRDRGLMAMIGLHGEGWGNDRLPDTLRAGLGPRLDLFAGGQRFRWQATATGMTFTDVSRSAWRLSAWHATILDDQLSLRMGIGREHDFGTTQTSVQVQIHGYF